MDYYKNKKDDFYNKFGWNIIFWGGEGVNNFWNKIELFLEYILCSLSLDYLSNSF